MEIAKINIINIPSKMPTKKKKLIITSKILPNWETDI